MGCGCKKNQAQEAPQPQAQPQPAQQNATVQESVKKIVEKYYNKK
jgi:hypothetical protein